MPFNYKMKRPSPNITSIAVVGHESMTPVMHIQATSYTCMKAFLSVTSFTVFALITLRYVRVLPYCCTSGAGLCGYIPNLFLLIVCTRLDAFVHLISVTSTCVFHRILLSRLCDRGYASSREGDQCCFRWVYA